MLVLVLVMSAGGLEGGRAGSEVRLEMSEAGDAQENQEHGLNTTLRM